MIKLFQDAFFRFTGSKGDFILDDTDVSQVKMLERAFLGPNGDFDFYCFPQEWPSASLGFGGLGAQVLTCANTSVFVDRVQNRALVYFGGSFAYETKTTDKFWDALYSGKGMPAVSKRGELK